MVQTINKQRFTQLIKSASFKELFNELGWDKINLSIPVLIDEEKYFLNAVAEKRGFVIFVCGPDSSGKIPISNIRKKIDQKITKIYYEHLIIYTDKDNFQQIWQLVIREQDKPIVVRETPYFSSQQPELLFQKLSGLFISLDDEDKVTIADVRANVKEQFNTNAEKVTKKFYTEFKAQHTAFLKFIEGIEDKVSREWYASLMLNRLMFIYFIQKKGFLDSNLNYLSDKLKETKKKKGENKFYSFYRNFLLVLFHQGLGAPERPEKLLKEIGKVPYLNGGLFDVHQIEKDYKKIEIEDKAFEKIFKFFDEYNWHLDTKITATGKDINPDVIGYIFEKYINDRAAMGAYYTKEDITEYIAKNTIIPFLFDEAKKGCKDAFENESSLWKMLQENPDRYIYDAVKHGIYEEVIASGAKQSELKIRPLPPEIQKGINPEIQQRLVKDVDKNPPQLLELRKEWNKPAPPEYALPTEIWREVVERRNRYFDVKAKIENGEVKEINDFITYNLNIRQFAQDAVHQYEGSDFINVFYKAITKVTVLDPTCGSGAFLFAALNILEPLYYECIQRMKVFVEEDDKQGGKKFAQFRKILEEIKHHPNEKYYIYKSIILNNLYGVDIMNEAVEIAKLRLFLKLVAEVEDFDHLEPLPDIDFNIRSGNTLVGFTSYKEIKNAYEEAEANGKLMFEEEKKLLKKIEDQALVVSKLYKEFKQKQAIIETKNSEIKKTKEEVQKRLDELNDLLNKYKAYEYGIDADDLIQQKKYKNWIESHMPFHWFSEFYEIIEHGGFDVILGNPPFIEYSKVRNTYSILGYSTIEAGNLYAYIIERAFYIMHTSSHIGMLKQLSAYCTPRMVDYQKFWFSNTIKPYISFFDDRPGKLFDGLEHIRIAISIAQKGKNVSTILTTNYNKFYSEFRPHLFNTLSYFSSNISQKNSSLLKINNLIEEDIVNKMWRVNKPLSSYLQEEENSNYVYYGYGYGYFGKILNFKSYFKGEKVKYSTGDKYIYLQDGFDRDVITALMNSSLFYWFYVNYSDGHNFTKFVIGSIPFNYPNTIIERKIREFNHQLMIDLKSNSTKKEAYYKATGKVVYQEFYPKLSKILIDEIDKVLAEHYGFTEEELDFIINYDIKYRMGKELEED